MNLKCLAVLAVALGSSAFAQTDSVAVATADSLDGPSELVARTLTGTGRIVLRWAPGDPGAWTVGRDFGYWVERATLLPGEDLTTATFTRLSPEPVRPWAFERYSPALVEANNLVGIVGQAVHGEYFEGGVQATGMQAVLLEAQELKTRFEFSLLAADLDSTAAEALGVRWVDENVVQGEDYIYRVMTAGQDSLIQVDTAYVFETPRAQGPLAFPSGFRIEPADSTATLYWDKAINRQAYAAYYIDRSSDGGFNWERITKEPYLGNPRNTGLFTTYVDTALANYTQYRYRLYGISHFATLSAPAEAATITLDLDAPPPAIIMETEHVEGTTARIKWQMPDGPLDRDFSAFYLGHAINHGGDYLLDLDNPLPASTREATDDRLIPTRANYYIVVAMDTAGNGSRSLPAVVALNDSIGPAAPQNMRVIAVDDSTGRVEIGWDPPGDLDLYAYRIYRRHNERDDWILRQDELHQQPTFVDTLNLKSLTNEVFYRIDALDFSFNVSDPGVVRVALPDLLPPVAPVFQEITPTDSTITVVWAPSSSFDVTEQILFRKRQTEDSWTELLRLNSRQTAFTDYEVEKRKVYEYTVQAVDSTGLRSNLALPVHGRAYDNGVRPGITNLTAIADTSSGFVQLQWDYPNPQEGEFWFVVYRALEGDELARYRSAKNAMNFIDRRVRFRKEQGYGYAVQVHYKDGGKSPLSEPVGVSYPRATEP